MKNRNTIERENLIAEYEQHLKTTCGVTDGTRALFVWHVSKFLDSAFGKNTSEVDLTALEPIHPIQFIHDLALFYMPNTRKSAVTSLRSFFRWLQMNGRCEAHLVKAVPTVSSQKHSELPVSLSEQDLATLLKTFDQSKPRGLRGYAAALCMVHLGLRIGEVARLQIDDVDWEKGVVRVSRSKGDRVNVLPLPANVGRALVRYIRRGRPATDSRSIFIRIYPNVVGSPATRDTLRSDIYAAFKQAGLKTPTKGTHILRHTAASRMVQKGATIKEIADVLGHRSIDTTAIYTKVDLPKLREVAMPWPVGAL